MDGFNTYKKNLKQKEIKKTENLLDKGKKKGVIATDLIDNNKKLDKNLLLNKQTVKTGLRDIDAEYLQGVIDADLNKEGIVDFENLPFVRLAEEKTILKRGPGHIKGCGAKAAKARWKAKQNKRVRKAEKLAAKHQTLLDKFAEYKTQRELDIDNYTEAIESYFTRENEKKASENKPLATESEMLTEINDNLTRNAFFDLRQTTNGPMGKIDTILTNYLLETNNKAEEIKNENKKAQDKRKKKAELTGVEDADEEIQARREDLENELLAHGEDVNIELETKVMDLDGKQPMQLSDMTTLFKKVISYSKKTYEGKNPKAINLQNEEVEAPEANIIKPAGEQTAINYVNISADAKRVLRFAQNLSITVPEELYYLLDLEDKVFLKSAKEKFKPEEHAEEAYILLMSAISQVYYGALSRFAGYNVTDGIQTYQFSKDLERTAQNYDIFNIEMMTAVRNLRDMTSAYAGQIRKNRLKINRAGVSRKDIADEILRDNIELVQGAQPTGISEEKKAEVIKDDKQEKIYEEWRTLLTQDIRGTVETDDKDMKQAPWVLSEYADKVFEIMKNNPDCQNLTGQALKSYLIALNDNLNANLLQLTDELPKSSIGEKFCYIPRLRDDFIEYIKRDKFGMLLRPDFFYRNELRNTSVLDDFFEDPKYKAAKNRQREIMKAINTALGTNLYTNALHLSDLWANETIQALLMSEPLDKEEQEKLALEESKKKTGGKKDEKPVEDQAEKKDEKEEEKKEEKKEEKPAKVQDGVVKNVINRILSKSDSYGVTDQGFKDTLTKIRATVHDNVAIVDRQISLMGICDTAKDVLKRNLLKKMGGEYLLGYSIITQDMVEYTIDNLMVFDGSAAEIQRTWDRKFNRTKLPSRLSTKIERMVASKVNAHGHRDEYYLRPKGFKVSAECKNKWEDTNGKTNSIINSIKWIHEKHIKKFLKDYVTSEELRKSLKSGDKLYKNDSLKLTKAQWEKIEDYFEDSWLTALKDYYLNGEFPKDISAKMDPIKDKLVEIFDTQLTENYNLSKKLDGDLSAKADYEASLITREQFTDGLKNNAVIVPRKTIVSTDISQHIYSDPALKNIFKKREDKEIFTKVLKEQLKNEKSGLHVNHPYLEDVMSIEQLANLSLLDYTQFFADLKALLCVVSLPQNAGQKAGAGAGTNQRLLLDEWRMSGQAGGDIYGIKEKLLADFFAGGMNDQVFAEKLAQYRTEALKAEEIDRMRFDAILADETEDSDRGIKFDYLHVIGGQVKQTDRIKRLGYSQKLWKSLRDNKDARDAGLEDSFADLIKAFLEYIRVATDKKNPQSSKIAVKQEIIKFGKIFDQIKINEVITTGEPVQLDIDKKSIDAMKKSGFFESYTKDGKIVLSDRDIRMIKTVKDNFAEIAKEDPSKVKMTFADCMGEILLFGYARDYFDAGGRGEEAFRDSNDDAYYATIIKKSNDFYRRTKEVSMAIAGLNLKPEEKEKLFNRLKPVIAGIKDAEDKQNIAQNISKFGVSSTHDMIERLIELYGPGQKAAEKLARSKKQGEIYKARKEYIDNYGEGEEKGKYKIVREYMMKDPETWRKIMTLSDDEFVDFMNEQEKQYGLGLKLLASPDYAGSKPIYELYIMRQWEDFKRREAWNDKSWRDTLDYFYDVYMKTRVGQKSVLEIIGAVQQEMIKKGIDKNEKSGTAMFKLYYLLNGDLDAFNLLYSQKDMFNAIVRLDTQYKKNVETFDDTINEIQAKQFKKEKCADTPEDEELLKEIVNICTVGDMVEKQRRALGADKVLYDMDEKARKGGEPTEEDRIYADYNLLMQIIRQYAFSVSEDKFRDGLLAKFKEFKGAQQLERNLNIYSDRSVLETKDAVRLELEIKKNQGKMLEKETFREYLDYVDKRAVLGSVAFVAYNADPKLDTKAMSEAAKYVSENITGDFGQADEEFIKGLLTERAAAFGMKDTEALKTALKSEKQRLLSLDKALRADGRFTTEDEIKKAIVFAFAQNASRIKLPLDGTHEGDVDEILTELEDRNAAVNINKPVSRIAQRDYEEFIEEMDIARFTMTKPQFMDICDKKRRYFELVDICVEKINAVSPDIKVQVGLYDYFKKDIFEALKDETDKEQFANGIADQLDKLIGTKVEGRNDLSADDIKQITLGYIPDSSLLMQQVSYNMVTAEEKLFSSDRFTRADVEKQISQSGKADIIEQYNALTVEEQKVFAIALTFPDIGLTDIEKLPSNEVLRDPEKEYKRELEIQEELAAFIYDKDFQPKIDYNVVMRRLMKTDSKTGYRRVSKTIFDKAIKYTRFCIDKKNEMRPKDISLLSDGGLSGEVARGFEGKDDEQAAIKEVLEGKDYYGEKTFKELFSGIAKEDAVKDKDIVKIAQRFDKYNNVQLNMLLHVLQDRTAVDYTTSQGRLSGILLQRARFVNEERREKLKNSFLCPDGSDKEFIARLNGSISQDMFEKAAETLFGYQLRDDISLANKTITVGDFAENALKRTTKVDWKLLERAMDLVEEIEDKNNTIQLCRQTVEHTTDPSAVNVKSRVLGQEIEDVFREKTTNHTDFFNDFLVREAKKDPEIAMPLILAYSGMSDNERMLVIHSLKHRDILDVSKDNRFTTAIGMNENEYVNELGRDRLADYYISHLGVPGAKNILATSQYDTRDAMKSLVSTQIDDSRNSESRKTFADMMEGKKVFNWKYIGGSRDTGVDWILFGNALKFVKRTENERKLLIGNAERYRSAGDIDKYGRFKYNYQFMRKNLYRSGNRFTRFLGRRIRAELEAAIPGYGVGQRVLMACLSPQMRNKMLDAGIVKPGVSKNAVTDALGYAGTGGTVVSGVASALKMVSTVAAAGTAVAGEGLVQASSALSGLINITTNLYNNKQVEKPLENEAELKAQSAKKLADAQKLQTEEQKLVTKDNHLNTEWILGEVSTIAAQSANRQDILDTLATCVNVLTGSSFGVQAFTNVFVGGIRAGITEIIHTARFITAVCNDKAMMDRYFADNGPLGKEIQALKNENVQKIIDDQNLRKNTGTRKILADCSLRKSETEFMGKMSNTELFRKAYGFKDFSEQAAYVGWNIVQTLMQSASPFATDPAQFVRASLLLAAIGCKDVIGKQDNESAQRVYNKLMRQDVR